MRADDFRSEVVDRLARIETKLDVLPCGERKQSSDKVEERITKLEGNWKVVAALLAAATILFNVASKVLM